MSRRRRTLPPVSPKLSPELRQLLAGIAEILETGEGVRGDPLDRKVTLRDLLDSGIGRLRRGASPGTPGGLASGVETPESNMTTPPAPENFHAVGGFYGTVTLTWDDPTEVYGNHGHTNIYRSEEDDFADALLVGRDGGLVYSDQVREDAVDPDDPTQVKGYYYWITFTSAAGVEGPPNSPDGTFAQPLADMHYVLELITGQVEASHLADALNERIDLIDGVGEGSVSARLADLKETLEEADQALAEQIDTAQASMEDDVAAVQQTLSAEVTRIDGELFEIGAQWTAQVQANNLIGGFGVHNDGTTVDAAFDVDRFWVGRTQENKRKPFIIDSDGVTYIDEVMIRQGSIQEGQLGPISIGKIQQPDGTPITTVDGLIRAEAINADALHVAGASTFTGDVSSNNYIPGSSGWIIMQNGYVEFNDATIRGNVDLTTLSVNGQSPDSGMVGNVSEVYWDDVTSASSQRTVQLSQSINRSAQVTVEEVPAGARVTVDLTRTTLAKASAEGTSKYYTTRTARDNTFIRQVELGWRHRIRCRSRTRLYIDGKLVHDHHRFIDETDQGLSVEARGLGPTTLFHTYDNYQSSSTIRVVVNTWVEVRTVEVWMISNQEYMGTSGTTDPCRITGQIGIDRQQFSGRLSRLG